ncbi:CopY/TcrY family copper transport repressor [Pseudoleptotrichia goodfellowii]|uniref:Copper transport repressor, CopY/TcrY family n=1 Tax=Pseudoleptotrichia goodfellowii F0264 TaxID=596323 RepID=D0GLS4_9FUSO|nr:CopY/TcrY family copper transport repressor [Pseudoleptotrichia goodfellowii]EEY34924.1 copper transport repressor, CopY/TcrY family [Pseudoleptotrichia goodfellowii F0264]
MEDNNCHITGAEWEVMRVVWANEEVTSKFVSQVLGEKMQWKHTTVKTLLNRLLEKNVLKKRESGNKYIYYTEYNEQEIAEKYVTETFDRICKTKVGGMIKELIEKSLLSRKDLENIEKIVKEKKKNAPEKIKCMCIEGQCNCSEHEHKHGDEKSCCKE